MVTQELKRDNVEDALQAVDGVRHENGLVGSTGVFIHAIDDCSIIIVANNDWRAFTSGDLSERRLDFWIVRVTGHDNDDGHVLIDEGERTMLEFTSKNTYKRSVRVNEALDEHKPSECI